MLSKYLKVLEANYLVKREVMDTNPITPFNISLQIMV